MAELGKGMDKDTGIDTGIDIGIGTRSYKGYHN
jgi:hypothetical protein